MEFLRDPLWQSIGAILALIAIAISVLIFYLQYRRKSLTYTVLANSSLLTVDEELQGKIKVLFEDKAITNLYLFIIEIVNSGNIPILPTDFHGSTTLTFNDGAKILSAEITKVNPNNINATIEPNKEQNNQYILNPVSYLSTVN